MILYSYSHVGDIVVIKIAILSNDSCYVNNIRSKCFKNNFSVEQLNSTMDLINYLIDEKSGIVLLDMKRPSKIISFIHEKILKNNIVDFKFVSMTDFSKCYIAVDNIYSFSATASNLIEVLENISLGKIHLVVNSFNVEELGERIEFLLNKFCLPITMKGYDYLLEGIKYRLINIEKKVSVKNDILPYLSSKFNDNVVNIEKCVRGAINHMRSNCSSGFVEFFADLHVTVKVFIEMLSNHIIKCS